MKEYKITKEHIDSDGKVLMPQDVVIENGEYTVNFTNTGDEYLGTGVIDPVKLITSEADWIEEVKPKRWRAEEDETYWVVDTDLTTPYMIDQYDNFDDLRYESGNYFRTQEEAQKAADKVKELLLSLHNEE